MTDADLTAAVALIEGNYAHYGEWKPGSFTDGLPFDERAAAAIATILQAVATGEMVVKPTWQDISMAPRDGTGFIFHQEVAPGFRMVGSGHFDADRNCFVATNFFDYDSAIDPTHWMPLPAPPEATP